MNNNLNCKEKKKKKKTEPQKQARASGNSVPEIAVTRALSFWVTELC